MKATEKVYKAQEEIADILMALHEETGLIPSCYYFQFVDVTTCEQLANNERRFVLGERALIVTGSGHK